MKTFYEEATPASTIALLHCLWTGSGGAGGASGAGSAGGCSLASGWCRTAGAGGGSAIGNAYDYCRYFD